MTTAERPQAPQPALLSAVRGGVRTAPAPLRFTDPVPLTTGLAAVSALFWLVALPRTGTDLAAAVQRAAFAAAHPLATYDASWFGGVTPQAYSFLAPVVMAAVGVRLSAALATVASVALFAALVERHRLPRPRLAAVLGAGTLLANLVAARVPFALGVATGLAALWLLAVPERSRRRSAWGGVLALLTSMLSPLAGLFLGVAAAGMLLSGRRRRGVLLGACTAVPMLVQVVAFTPQGVEPMGLELVVPSVGVTLLVAWASGRGRPALRAAALVYAAGTVAAYFVSGPVGANSDRLALLFGVPLLAGLAPLPTRPLAGLLVLCSLWPAQFPLADLQHARDPAGEAGYYTPLLEELHALGTTGWRVEVVPGRDHWEAARLSGQVLLARGWDTQLDTLRDPLFYQPELSPLAYRTWLQENSVRYIALSDGPLDWSGRTEAALLADPPPWLHLAWADDHWEVWEVSDPLPLVGGVGQVVDSGPYGLTITADGAGHVPVRLHWSPWLTVDGDAVLLRAPGDWTMLEVPGPGTYRLTSRDVRGGPAVPAFPADGG